MDPKPNISGLWFGTRHAARRFWIAAKSHGGMVGSGVVPISHSLAAAESACSWTAFFISWAIASARPKDRKISFQDKADYALYSALSATRSMQGEREGGCHPCALSFAT
jgi:hypothetical protein